MSFGHATSGSTGKCRFLWFIAKRNSSADIDSTSLVESRVIVELKSVDGSAPIHEAIILTYVRLSGHRIGLLINFNVSVLKDGVRRFVV